MPGHIVSTVLKLAVILIVTLILDFKWSRPGENSNLTNPLLPDTNQNKTYCIAH